MKNMKLRAKRSSIHLLHLIYYIKCCSSRLVSVLGLMPFVHEDRGFGPGVACLIWNRGQWRDRVDPALNGYLEKSGEGKQEGYGNLIYYIKSRSSWVFNALDLRSFVFEDKGSSPNVNDYSVWNGDQCYDYKLSQSRPNCKLVPVEIWGR